MSNLCRLLSLFSILFLVVSMRFPDPPVFEGVQHYPSICYLPPDSGLCSSKNRLAEENEERDLLIRHYFDITTEQCYPFGVQNCGGNENRFPSRTACQNYCRIEKK